MLHLIAYPAARLDLLRTGPLVVVDHPALFEITGPGAVTCLQGVVSHDIVKPGPGSIGYGAMLTAKGAIIVDLWTIRLEDSLWVIVDRTAREQTAASLRRLLPPRLAKVIDRSDDSAMLWVLGQAAVPAVVTFPLPGHAGRATLAGRPAILAMGGPDGWFHGAVAADRATIEAIGRELGEAGVPIGDGADLRAAKVVAGFPSLGAEIGERTLPQEVDFDRLAGVSYTKGCFVGQETVARLHFRGHPNWVLRRVSGIAPVETEEIIQGDKVVGRLGTVLRFEDGRTIGLAVVRREVEPGAAGLPVTIAATDGAP
ncbi:MAG: YgfZ/GcvT domain-containing protein [Gemmatimonadales bacterium]